MVLDITVGERSLFLRPVTSGGRKSNLIRVNNRDTLIICMPEVDFTITFNIHDREDSKCQ